MIRKTLTTGALCLLLPLAALADDDDDGTMTFGLAGLLSNGNKEDLPPVIPSAGMPLADAPWALSFGTYYEFEGQGDGSQELALIEPEFFRAIWLDEMVVASLETRPLGLASVECDGAGEMEIGFIATHPGVN